MDEEEGGGVDVDVLGGDGGEFLSDGVEDFAEEDHGGEDVGFVDEGDFLVGSVAADGFFEGVAADAFAAFAGEVEGVGGGGAVVGLGGAAGGEEAFGVFADDGEVDVAGAVAFEGGVVLRVELDGAGAGVEVEAFAKVDLRGHFAAIGPADVGEAHGAEEDGVGFFASFEGGFGEGGAGAEEFGSADGLFGEGELVRAGGLEDGDGGGGDFRADAVTGEDGDVVIFHAGLRAVCGLIIVSYVSKARSYRDCGEGHRRGVGILSGHFEVAGFAE